MELFNHLLLRSSEKAVTEVSCISAHLVSFFLFFLSMVQYVNSSCSSLIFNHHSISKLIISLTLTLLQGRSVARKETLDVHQKNWVCHIYCQINAHIFCLKASLLGINMLV